MCRFAIIVIWIKQWKNDNILYISVGYTAVNISGAEQEAARKAMKVEKVEVSRIKEAKAMNENGKALKKTEPAAVRQMVSAEE